MKLMVWHTHVLDIIHLLCSRWPDNIITTNSVSIKLNNYLKKSDNIGNNYQV